MLIDQFAKLAMAGCAAIASACVSAYFPDTPQLQRHDRVYHFALSYTQAVTDDAARTRVTGMADAKVVHNKLNQTGPRY